MAEGWGLRRRKNRILPLHFGSPSASTEVVHRYHHYPFKEKGVQVAELFA